VQTMDVFICDWVLQLGLAMQSCQYLTKDAAAGPVGYAHVCMYATSARLQPAKRSERNVLMPLLTSKLNGPRSTGA
jgi:hypothetical protein